MVTTTSIIVNLFWRNIKINRIAGLVTFQILLCFVFWASCSVQSVQASEMSPKSALVFLAAGAEEMEVVITVDTLRRAKVGQGYSYFMSVFFFQILIQKLN